MAERVDTMVIGAGQAGLSISYYLTQQGREHVVLEKHRVGEAWKGRKWDSFTLVLPNWTLRLPGHAYQGDDPDGFLAREAVAQYLDDYVTLFNPPLHLGVEATAIEGKANGDGGGFLIETNAGRLEASNVVVATGTFQEPKLPALSQQIAPDVVQIHSSLYRNPQQLPPGAVLVVGSGQSGTQIAEELYQHGRKVYLCTGRARRAPRRYRGKDFAWWVEKLGIFENTVDTLTSPKERFEANPQASGREGGHTLNLHQFALDGVTLLGRLKDASGSKVWLAEDLHENLASGDKFEAEFKKGVDKYIEKTGTQAPLEELPELRAGYDAEPITELDLRVAGITTIIWASGYRYDFGWVRFPIQDAFGYPIQQRGVTAHPGLYFLGLHWLHTLKSSLFVGVGEDAAHVAQHIASRA